MSGTPGKMSKRANPAASDAGMDDDPPIKKAREDDKRAFSSPGLSKLGGLNGLNRRDRVHEKPDELFRKDLISAMKLADAEHLEPDTYVTIADPWKQDWERGVQVPVAQTLNKICITEKPENTKFQGDYAFKLPPKKMLYACKDENYQTAIHELHETHKLAEQVCRYDLDNVDVAWLNRFNELRTLMGEADVEEWVMEKVMEELETQCYNNMQTKIKTVEGLGIEYDENVVCDVCRSPDSEDGNEMVFCDACDICVHQACYGVGSIPKGSWLCRSCAIGISTPKCVLCPKLGGAMKSTKSGSKWAHVACALWIPEVNIGDPEKMEPITRVSHIPASRWSLVCNICRVKEGACIQCAVKTCKTAFHVTCAFSNNLDMKTILDETEDDVQLKAYCSKHSKKSVEATPKSSGDMPKKECEMTEEEKTELRSHRLEKLAEEFYTCVTSEEVAEALKELVKEDVDMVDYVKNYWVLKRKANFNKSLLTPKTEEADLLSKQREDSLIARMKMFIHLRQDLERVRNLCYMVSRREKTRRQFYNLKENIFNKQVEVVASSEEEEGSQIYEAITEAHKLHADDSVYDQYDYILLAAKIAQIKAIQADQRAAEENNEHVEDSIATTSMQEEQEEEEAESMSARRPSLDSTDDDGEMVEQSVEEMREQKNRKLASVKMSKLIRDRKENDRRKRQAEAAEAAKKEMEEKKEMVKEEVKDTSLDTETKTADNESPCKVQVEEVKPSTSGRGRKPKVLPESAKSEDEKDTIDKADKETSKDTDKIVDKNTEQTKNPEKLEVAVKTPGKVGRHRKRPLPVDDNSSAEKTAASPSPGKTPDKKEVKPYTGKPRGRPRKNRDKDISNTDKATSPNENTTSLRRRLLSEKVEDNAEKEVKKEVTEPEEKKEGDKLLDIIKHEKPEVEVKESEPKDQDQPEKKRRRTREECTSRRTRRERSNSVQSEENVEIKRKETRGRKPRPKPDDSSDQKKKDHSSTDSKDKRHSEKKVESSSQSRKQEEDHKFKTCGELKQKDDTSRESSVSRTSSRIKTKEEKPKAQRESSTDTLEGDHSPETIARRSLRSTTPVCPLQAADQRAVRSSTPVREATKALPPQKETEEQPSDAPLTKKSRLRRNSKVSPPIIVPDSSHSQPPESCSKTDTAAKPDSSRVARTKRISVGEPTVELARLRDSDFPVKEDTIPVKKTTHNLRVKDQNRPSPKSFKERSADIKKEETVTFSNFTFSKQSLKVPWHIKQKVESRYKQSKKSLSGLVDNTQRKILSFLSRTNGVDKKENEPAAAVGSVNPGSRHISPATSSVSPRSYSPRGSHVQHPEPGCTPDLRSVRRQIETDLTDSTDAAAAPSLESGGERRLRSSRDATPEHEPSRFRARKKSEDFARKVTEKCLVEKLQSGGEDLGLDSEAESMDTTDLSDADSDIVHRRSSRRVLKPLDLGDEESRHSSTSTSSRYSTRSSRTSDAAAATSLSKALSKSLPPS